jgi:demethylmenaquinone methyltransferase/2-methoxy-6-polyprenyl-1,4-benzoquinol methylase
VSRAGLDKQPRDVAGMFDGVARRYDLTNAVLSGGLDRYWRTRTRAWLDLGPGDRILDVAAGTGVSTAELARSGAWAVASDFSLGMLAAGRSRRDRQLLPFVAADAMRLPFASAAFDAVTVSFGLRNVLDPGAALAEFARVTKPGGTLLVCEFSTPVLAGWRQLYLNYLMRGLPAVARVVSSNPDAYVYLAESIRVWPAQRALATTIAQAGWVDVQWRNLTGGIVAMHRAEKPAA